VNCDLMFTYDTPATSHDMGYLYEACDQIPDFCPIVVEKNVHICSMWIKTN
jgi:hypothetical protein